MTTSSTARLRASVAISALTMGISAGTAWAQQAGTTFDFGTAPTFAHTAPTGTADVGSILVQNGTGLVSATGTGSVASILMNSNTVADQTYNGAYTAQNNLFAATASGNITGSTVVYSFSPTTAGDTAVAGSYQSRISTADVTATVSGSNHTAQFSNADAAGEAILTGTLVVDNNDITATATANNSTSSISLASGVNVLEDATAAQASSSVNTLFPAGVDSTNAADVLVSTAQVAAGATSVTGTVGTSNVLVNLESVNGATATVSGSNLTASATGNMASGSIASDGTTASITASAAVTNLQVLDIDVGDAIGATLTGSQVRLNAGDDAGAADQGQVDNSTLTISGNALASVAEGNDSSQTINLNANAISGSGTASFSDSVAADAGIQGLSSADVLASNTQVVTAGTSLTALTSGSSVILQVVDEEDKTIDNNTLAITGNSIGATARSLDTTNSVTLQSGSTLSATAAATNVQIDEGSVVLADNDQNLVELNVDFATPGGIEDSTLRVQSNSLTASATGARANNDLVVANGTNNLSLDANTVTTFINASPTNTEVAAPTVGSGFVVMNDQGRVGGSVTADSDSRVRLDVSDAGQTVDRVTANNNLNTISASAIGATADNLVSLTFNTLTGAAATGGDSIASSANNQTISVSGGGTASISATNQAGVIIDTEIDHTVSGSTITTSSNTVSATAMGNQTTNNDVVVNATNVVITGGVDAGAQTILSGNFGDLTASGAFTSASVQEVAGTSILASQVRTGSSNLIETDVAGNISGSTILSEENTLSVLAVGNEAANGVSVGTTTTSAVEASSASANVQLITSGNIDGLIGVVGTDGVATYNSANSAPSGTGTIADLGGGQFRNDGVAPFVLTFGSALTAEEVQILTDAGFTVTGANTASLAVGATASTTGRVGIAFTNPNTTFANGDETFGITAFVAAGSAPTLNNAGVIISRGADVLGSTLSVADNVIAGEVRGNVATNTTSVTGTTVTATSAATATTDVNGSDILPTNASTVVTNLQSIDAASDIDMAVAGSFAIQDDAGNPLNITNSQQNVDGNLQQSYATANRATNAITITATNSTADGVIENDQRNSANVDTSSDLDLMAAFGMTTSTTSIDSNVNQSVATGNLESSTFTVRATNVSEEDGTATDASINKSTDVVIADAILGTEQSNNGVVTASATTDAFNEEVNLSGASVDNIDGSTASISSNVTIAQATANNSTLTASLGSASTANYDASGAISALQTFNAAVNSTTNVEVGLVLNDDSQTVMTSTVNLNGNQGSATARGNVLATDLVVAGTNIEAGTAGNDAVVNGDGGTNTAAFLLSSEQSGTAAVTANSSAMSVVLDLTSTSSTATNATLQTSTATVSSNRSTATATVNEADNAVALGAVGSTSSLTAEAGLSNVQSATVGATATGGMLISADIDTTETGANAVNAVAGSQLSLNSNASTASATGNTATNSVSAVSTSITAGSAVDAYVRSDTTFADAAFAFVNDQSATGTVQSTNTANTVRADLTAHDAAVTASTVSLAGNSVSAVSTSNNASNTVSLGAAGTTSTLTSTGALVSNQSATGSTLATTGVTVLANIDSSDVAGIGVTGSTLTVSNNTSLASATNNNVLNTFSAVATNMSGGGTADATTTGTEADADYAIASRQVSSGVVTATNTANSFLVDVDSAFNGVGTSTVGLAANSVEARATGNIAVNNSMALGGVGTASISSTGAINNNQTNSAVVNAFADSSVQATVDTSNAAVAAVSGSTVRIENNATTAMARGNLALNALNVTSAAATSGDSVANFTGTAVTAAYGILNTQNNSSAVTGTIAGTSYQLALNSAVGGPSASIGGVGSTYILAGNVADAVAYGNVATNSVTLASLNASTDDATAMIGSVQNNSGAITATLGGSSAQFIADGTVSGSTVGVSGNAFRATAVGNYATSSVTRD